MYYRHNHNALNRDNMKWRIIDKRIPPLKAGDCNNLRVFMPDNQLTFVTLPDLMQRVQTCIRTWEPLAPTALIGCKFGLENFLDLLLA
jgi:hypothetical protein